MGTPEFAVPSLELLRNEGVPIQAVVTGADKARGRGRLVSSTAVAASARKAGLPLLQPEHLRDPSFLDQLTSLRADLFVVVAFRILPPEVFLIPRLGSFNLHASLLPAYRGAAPINRAIMNGETRTGVTTFLLAQKVDTGSILLQEECPINPDDDAGSLHDRLAVQGARIVLNTT
ncbi:MAG: formyltransferase family protein, partial [Ignavibacteria bacterium]|nr:formyltransferase family protein [Ignavibacteria bacterium]